jgi:two-component system, LytTR family, response regulator
MLRAVIIDDEKAGIETLKILSSRNQEQIKIIASTLRPEEGINLIEDYKPDVVFLDISMPTMSGFELLAQLQFRAFKLIFTTAHRDYAISAIKNNAFDYLLKPIDALEFKNCIGNLYNEAQQTAIETTHHKTYLLIEIPTKEGISFIKQKDIIRLEASRSYSIFYLSNGQKQIASKSLSEFEQKLDPALFYRCHHSHIVNLQEVEKFINHEGFYALMSDRSMVNISKKNKDSFIQSLKSL